MTSSLFHDLSAEPSVLDQLTDEQRLRLTDLLDGYLSSLEGGVPPDINQLVTDHPDLAEPLTTYLRHLRATASNGSRF